MGNKYLDLLNERKADYKTWSPIYCPALDDYVFFNMQGFNHLRFKIDDTPRNPNEVIYKLNLLPFVRFVIASANPNRSPAYRLYYNQRFKEHISKRAEYWSIESLIGTPGVRLRVILRREGGERIFFWSVMKLK